MSQAEGMLQQENYSCMSVCKLECLQKASVNMQKNDPDFELS